MNVLSPSRPPLHDLLGVSFVFNSRITALVWDRDFACFGLGDGAVAMLRAHWEGAPGSGTSPQRRRADYRLHRAAAAAGDFCGAPEAGAGIGGRSAGRYSLRWR